jgi:Xaa-Pro dipeptidase
MEIAHSASKTDRLANLLRDSGVDAFLAWHPVTMGYLHGFHEGGGERFVTLAVKADGQIAMICPALSETQAKRVGVQDVRPWKDGEDPLALFKDLAQEWNLRSAIIAVDNEMPAHMVLAMQQALPAALFKPGQEIMARLMSVKEPREIELLHQAGEIADKAFPAALAMIRPGVTEREVQDVLNAEMKRLGGTPLFAIVATGANGAEPHHLSDDTPIKEGDVIILDFGCTVGGYPSDITRTVCCGRASDEAKKIYDIVYRAHMAARSAIAVGVPCEEIDRAARRVIEDAGYGAYFMHRTGHGIGMRGHEEPYIVEGNKTPLTPGHCFSIEPGIYLPGNLGVRIENIVVATADGHKSFNNEPASHLEEVLLQ